VRLLILSNDLVGPRMAGPGARYWELARVLSQYCAVTLAAPLSGEAANAAFRTAPLTLRQPDELTPLLAEADAVLSSGFMLYDYPQVGTLSVPWIVDLYIPAPTEGLALYAARPIEEQDAIHRANNAMLTRFMTLGDFFICASERQHDLYLGLLAAAGRLNPHTYAQDNSLRRLIDVVPYGLPAEPPVHRRTTLKGAAGGIAPDDRLIVWGGGVWDWLDPLTLLHAMPRVIAREPRARLYFPGARHPYAERVPDMPMRRRAVELSDALGLTGSYVFWGDWIPYEERANYLLEADIGVSLHFPGVETRYAYRTRLLDYIWAGLPMVVAEGDVLADLARERGLGLVVPPQDVAATAEALLALLAEPDARAARRERFAQVAAECTWERVAAPLVCFVQQPTFAADRLPGSAPTERIALDAAQRELEQTRQRAESLERETAALREKVAALQGQVTAYERGRFIRLMASLKRWKPKP